MSQWHSVNKMVSIKMCQLVNFSWDMVILVHRYEQDTMKSISQFSGEITISTVTPQFWKWNMWTDVTSQSCIHCRTWCSISHNELKCVHTQTVSKYLLRVHSPYTYYFNIGNQNNKKYLDSPSLSPNNHRTTWYIYSSNTWHILFAWRRNEDFVFAVTKAHLFSLYLNVRNVFLWCIFLVL